MLGVALVAMPALAAPVRAHVGLPTAFTPAAVFVLQLGVLVLAARLGGSLFARWRLPVILGEISGGIVVGPHLFGGMALPGFPKGLMSNVADVLVTQGPLFGVCMVALMVLLFLIGLETDVRLLRRYSMAGALVGAGGGLAAFAAGCTLTAASSVWLLDQAAAWYEPGPLFVGVVAATTSIGILARVLAQQNRLESPEGVVALSGAVVDNMLGVALLAVASGVAEAVAFGAAPSVGLVLAVVVRTLLAVAVAGTVGFFVARRVNGMSLRDRSATGAVAASAACALVAGGLFGRLGLSPLIGAYVMGVAFSSSDLRHQIQERVEFVNVALVPACFAMIGTMVDPNLLADVRVLSFVGLFLAAAMVAKILGCGLPARLAGLNGIGCLRVGVASMPRGEATLAVAAVALAMGVMPQGVLFAVIVLMFVSCLMVPGLTAWVFTHGGSGTRVGFPSSTLVSIVFRFPSQTAATLVLNRVIELFENEGFYVHMLNRRESLYRLTRESQVVGVQRNVHGVVFQCTERERDLINTVMIEVGAGIEQNLRELRKPLDPLVLQKRLQDDRAESAALPPGHALRAYISVETLRPRLLADTKAGVIEELLDVLHEQNLLLDRHEAGRAVFEREQSLSTGLEHGIALPHGRTDAVNRLVCAIGLKPEGLDFGAMDGKPARVIVLVLAPQNAAAPQLQFISQITQALNEQGRSALLACDSAEDMLAVLAGAPVRAASESSRRGGKSARPLACLQWQSISLDLGATTKEDVLDRLLALCARSGAVADIDGARQALLVRERKTSTGMENGVALPHARTEAVDRMVCALGICREGIDFGSLDGQPSRIFVMTLVPPSVTGDYIRLMGAVMRGLDDEGRRDILAAKSSQDVLAVLSRGEST
jgi:mannitol/fructose-specific phosphotransferase system IIA component (Ntr-type)/Kef-type K+ transport system membrane component KefB